MQLVILLAIIALTAGVPESFASKKKKCVEECKGGEELEKLEKDMCIHKCTSIDCYNTVYGDIDGQIPTYTNPSHQIKDRHDRKDKFNECARKEI
mmetsp:Transcript_9521/g.4998  ORF Transcript_9521/g.4998 Transcript_9521/m.4998 type:complete len:95 (-) Transcript_9521:77-361(-)